MTEFHRTKPLRVFKGENMDIVIESSYPVECFGAPRQYVAYLTVNHDIKALCVGNTKHELLTNLQLWNQNGLVYRLIKDDIKRYSN